MVLLLLLSFALESEGPELTMVRVREPQCIVKTHSLPLNLGIFRAVGTRAEAGQRGWAQAEHTVTKQCSGKGILLKTPPVLVEVLNILREKDPGAGSKQVGDQESKTEIHQLFHVWLEPLTPEPNYEVYFDVIMML